MTKTYQEHWNDHFSHTVLKYPAESLVRVLNGSFPKLTFNKDYSNKIVLDMGCGSGNNLIELHNVGFKQIIAVDLTQKIIDKAKENLKKWDITNCIFKVGTNTNIPVQTHSIDFLISWGNYYYMDNEKKRIEDNLQEIHRCVKPNGIFIAMQNKYEADVYKGTTQIDSAGQYYFNHTFNTIMRRFKNKEELIETLSPYFKNIQIADQEFDCFGKNYGNWVIVCQNR